MRISRLCIENFRNFHALDIELSDQVVIIGPNRIGKSNLIHALRLVLDPSLPDTARQLTRTDFWDGLGDVLTSAHVITISVEITDFEQTDALLADLAEHIVGVDPLVARITYLYRPKSSINNAPTSENDFEFLVYGGSREENRIGYELRSRLPLEVLHALRDAERDLSAWNNSPLRPLLEQAISQLDRNELTGIAQDIMAAQERLLNVPKAPDPKQSDEVASNVSPTKAPSSEESIETAVTTDDKVKPLRSIDAKITGRLQQLVGASQAVDTKLGFSPTDPDRLLRTLRLFIDDGRRGVTDASLGSANLLYLTMKALHIDWLADEGERDHTFWAIEEPEAHLHPHLQRLLYRDFLVKRSHQRVEDKDAATKDDQKTIILTTHSPHIVSVAPIKSIVLLKNADNERSTIGVSAANINLDQREIADIERYLDINRGEILFASKVVLVEGDAEEYLVPLFAKLCGYDFDELVERQS